MGNCSGKQSKKEKREEKEEIYRPSEKETDSLVKTTNKEATQTKHIEEPVTRMKLANKEVNLTNAKDLERTDTDTPSSKVDNTKGQSEIEASTLKAETVDTFISKQNETNTDEVQNNTGKSDRQPDSPEKQSIVKEESQLTNLKSVQNRENDISKDPKLDDKEKKKEEENSSLGNLMMASGNEINDDNLFKPYQFTVGYTPDDGINELDFIDKQAPNKISLNENSSGENTGEVERQPKQNETEENSNTKNSGESNKDIRVDNNKITDSGKDSSQSDGKQTGYDDAKFACPPENKKDSIPSRMKDAAKGDKWVNKDKAKGDNKEKVEKWAKKKKEMKRSQNATTVIHHIGTYFHGNNVVNYMPKTEKKSVEEEIQPTNILNFEEMKVLQKVSDSVGYLHGPKGSGTCWRVGEDKIMTAAHVIIDNIWNTSVNTYNEKILEDFYVDFEYISEISKNTFKLVPKILYLDKSADVGILQLLGSEIPFPPALTHFHSLDPVKDQDKNILLISHDKGCKKNLNYGIGLWNPTEDNMKGLEDFCRDNGYENGYLELDRTDRLVIQCEFIGGSSGSPGIIIMGREAYVVLLYIRGFPDFYHSQRFPEAKRRKFPKSKLLQQGVNIGSVINKMLESSCYLELGKEIFPVEAELKQMNRNQYAITGDAYYTANAADQNIGYIGKPSNVPEDTTESTKNSVSTSQQITDSQSHDKSHMIEADYPQRQNQFTPLVLSQISQCSEKPVDDTNQNIVDKADYHIQTSHLLVSGKQHLPYQEDLVLSFGKNTSTPVKDQADLQRSTQDKPVGDGTEAHLCTDTVAHTGNITAQGNGAEKATTNSSVTDITKDQSNMIQNKKQGRTKPVVDISLDEWLGHSVINLYRDIQPKEADLHRISKSLNPSNLVSTGLQFGLRHNNIEMIKKDSEIQDQCYHVIYKWKQKTGRDATFKKLLEHMHKFWEDDNTSVDVDELKKALSKIEI